jgi:hypothetical protein
LAAALALVLALTQSAGAQPTGTQHADKPTVLKVLKALGLKFTPQVA